MAEPSSPVSGLTEEALARIVISAVLQANSERRKEDISHVCFCSIPQTKAQHDLEHEALRRFMKTMDRIEKTSWAFVLVVLTLIAGSCWDVVAGMFRGGLPK